MSYPGVNLHHINGKTFIGVVIATRTYAVLAELYKMFYSASGKKYVPDNIWDLFDNVSFAHWIMCDGSRTTHGGLILCTDSFTPQDVVRLMNLLLIKYGITTSYSSVLCKTSSYLHFSCTNGASAKYCSTTHVSSFSL